jgi:hypothetical protein
MTLQFLGTGRTCDSFSLNVNIKRKQLYCILPTSTAEAVPTQACKLLGITVFAPFCGLGLCQTQTHNLFDIPVCSPQPKTVREQICVSTSTIIGHGLEECGKWSYKSMVLDSVIDAAVKVVHPLSFIPQEIDWYVFRTTTLPKSKTF